MGTRLLVFTDRQRFRHVGAREVARRVFQGSHFLRYSEQARPCSCFFASPGISNASYGCREWVLCPHVLS